MDETFRIHYTEYEEKVKALVEDGYNKPQAHSMVYNDTIEKYRDEMKENGLAAIIWNKKNRNISKTALRLRQEEDNYIMEF